MCVNCVSVQTLINQCLLAGVIELLINRLPYIVANLHTLIIYDVRKPIGFLVTIKNKKNVIVGEIKRISDD